MAASAGRATPVPLDGDDAPSPLQQQRPRQPTRTRPDLHDRPLGKTAGGPRNAAREVEIEDEVLAQALTGGELKPADDLTQRR